MSSEAQTAATEGPAPGLSNISRDDFPVADMTYYNLLNVSANCTDLDLKKAYLRAAITNHPDKGGDEETFKRIGEAYQCLSDSNARADYDKNGKKKVGEEAEVGLKEATEMVRTPTQLVGSCMN